MLFVSSVESESVASSVLQEMKLAGDALGSPPVVAGAEVGHSAGGGRGRTRGRSQAQRGGRVQQQRALQVKVCGAVFLDDGRVALAT